MNWFIYVGGGILFWFTVNELLHKSSALRELDTQSGFLEALTYFMIVSSPFLVWTWICVKFIN